LKWNFIQCLKYEIQAAGSLIDKVLPSFISGVDLVNCFIFSDHELLLSKRWSPWLSFCFGRDSGGEDVLLKKPLTNQVFKILAEGLTFGNLVSLAITEGAIFFYSEKGRIIWYRLWALNSRLILDCLEDILDGKLQRRVLTHLDDLEWIRRRV